jgi:NlpC/P60 family
VRRALVIAVAAALALAPPALAGRAAVAEVRGPTGDLLGQAGLGASSYGNLLRIGSATTTASGVDVRDVSLLAGRIWAARIFVPAHGLHGAVVSQLVVGGRTVAARTNALVPLGPRTYLVALQKAVLPGRHGGASGVVGLRVYIGDPGLGVAAGTQVLVGLAHAALGPRSHARRELPALVLGLDPARVALAGVHGTPEPLFPGPTSIGERVVALAERYLGLPYVWGGGDPSSGFDCSGLTMYVYHQVGVDLVHFAGAQWNEGPRIQPAELQPGDLVFFEARPNGPAHVGIYVGDGRFIHAPHTGDVVKISSLSEPWYALQYVGAVRPYAH